MTAAFPLDGGRRTTATSQGLLLPDEGASQMRDEHVRVHLHRHPTCSHVGAGESRSADIDSNETGKGALFGKMPENGVAAHLVACTTAVLVVAPALVGLSLLEGLLGDIATGNEVYGGPVA